jgi:hypothetical protein
MRTATYTKDILNVMAIQDSTSTRLLPSISNSYMLVLFHSVSLPKVKSATADVCCVVLSGRDYWSERSLRMA